MVVSDSNGRLLASYSVELVGSDAMHDLAVLRIVTEEDASEIPYLQPIKMGSSSDLKAN